MLEFVVNLQLTNTMIRKHHVSTLDPNLAKSSDKQSTTPNTDMTIGRWEKHGLHGAKCTKAMY